MALGLKLQLFPEPPACQPTLQTFNLPSLYSHIEESPIIQNKYLSLSFSCSHSCSRSLCMCEIYIYIYGCVFFFFYKFIYLFIYFWLCWVFVSVRGPSPVAESGGHSSSRCACLSLSRPLLLRSTGSRRAGSVVVAHGLSCSAACGILPDQGSNPRPLHWQADSQPLRHQGSPGCVLYVLCLTH